MLRAHAVYEQDYLLGNVDRAGPAIAAKQVEVARQNQRPDAVGHGATGKCATTRCASS